VSDDIITQEFLDSLVDHRSKGVSGLMRVRNEEKTLKQSIESVINSLDELVIIYHDCTDNSVSILKKLAQKYNKICLYEYTLPVIPANTGGYVEGFNPCHSLANYYNYGLSKCKYNWFLKIDADQIYFENELSSLIDKVVRSNTTIYDNEYFCMVGFNVSVDKDNNVMVHMFEDIPLNGYHGDHFLTKIKRGSWFIIPRHTNGEYKQCEEYREPNINWNKFNFNVGGGFWYHMRFFKDTGEDFILTEEEITTVDKYLNFDYLRSRLCDKHTDENIHNIVKSFSANKKLLLREYF